MSFVRRTVLPLVLASLVCIASTTLVCIAIIHELVREAPAISDASALGVMKHTARSSVETSDEILGYPQTVTTANTRFVYRTIYINRFFDNAHERGLLLQETVVRKQSLAADDFTSSISAKAWLGEDGKATVPVWSVHQIGDEGEITDSDAFYRVKQYARDDRAPDFTFYNLVTGAKVYDSSSETLFDIGVSNASGEFSRYVAYQSYASMAPPAECLKDPSIEGVLQYGSANRVQDRILIRTNSSNAEDTRFAAVSSQYQGKNVTAEDGGLSVDGTAARKTLSRFVLHITFSTELCYIDLPIENDRIDWSRVRHSPNIMPQEETPQPHES